MKKTLLILIIGILLSSNVNAQNHEAKFNVLDLIAFKSVNVTYQYILNEESGAGVSVFFPLTDQQNLFSQDEKFTITPFYRHYFELSGVSNVFAEAFFAINSGEGEFEGANVDYTDGAFGFAAGKSYISDGGLVAELFVGAGRNLFEAEGAPDFVPRIGINLGYRF